MVLKWYCMNALNGDVFRKWAMQGSGSRCGVSRTLRVGVSASAMPPSMRLRPPCLEVRRSCARARVVLNLCFTACFTGNRCLFTGNATDAMRHPNRGMCE